MIVVLVALVGLMVLAGPALANWGGDSGGECGYRAYSPDEHCYAATKWEPNVHKNIRQVWAYVTATDAALPPALPHSTEEFANYETWVSWAEPGEIVEYPHSEREWVEAGLQFTAEGCHTFWEYEFGIGTTKGEKAVDEGFAPAGEGVCEGTRHQLFVFEKAPSTGEVCVTANSDRLACSPGPDLPSEAFTQLESGMEIAFTNPPAALQGAVEPFATGGTDGRWKGPYRHATAWFDNEATCSHGNEYGFLEFSAPCIEPHGEPGDFNEEEPLSDTRLASQLATNENEEEADSGPESSEPPPKSAVDDFGDYKNPEGPKLTIAQVENKATKSAQHFLINPEGGPLIPNEEVREDPSTSAEIVASATLDDLELAKDEPKLAVADLSAGQRAFEESSVYVVELIGKFYPKGVSRPPWDGWNEETLPPSYTHLNLVYNAVNGELLRRTLTDEATPREEANKQLSKTLKREAAREAKDRSKCKKGKLCQSWEEACRIDDEEVESREQRVPWPEETKQEKAEVEELYRADGKLCIETRKADCYEQGRFCSVAERCAFGEAEYCKLEAAYRERWEKCLKEGRDESACVEPLYQEYSEASLKVEDTVYSAIGAYPNPPPGKNEDAVAMAQSASYAPSESPPPSVRQHEQRENEPPQVEAVVLAGGKEIRGALVIVKLGKTTIVKSRRRDIPVPARNYSVSAELRNYRCPVKPVEVRGRTLVTLKCAKT
jgi:hypothetical protein